MIKISIKKIIFSSVLLFLLFLFIFILIFLTPLFRTDQNVKSVSIYFYPRGVENCMVQIYDNDDIDYSKFIASKIIKSRLVLIDRGIKTYCEEGFYKIYIDYDNESLSYELSDLNEVFDCQKKKNLKCDLLNDIYKYLAIQKLNQVIIDQELF